MTRKRRYLISAAVLAACAGIALGALAMLPPRPGVTKANFDLIQKGMTGAEVEAILGVSPSERTMLSREGVAFADFRGDDGASATIDFRDDVATGNKTWTASTKTLSEKLRRWLRLAK